jgi:peptide/nickel transport system substrate-binding protein
MRSRSRFASLAAGSLLLLITACSSAGGSAASTSPGKPVSGGTVTFGLEADPENLDPNVASTDEAGMVLRQVVDSLVYENAQHQIVPWLATSWTIGNDNQTYTFTLRRGVTFQDGTPFNAAAVKFNLDRIANPATKSELAVSLLGPYKSSVVLSQYVVQVNFSQPYTAFLPLLSEVFMGMDSPAAVRKEGAAGFASHPVGTGPYEVVSYTPQSQVVLKRNPAYNWPPAGSTHTGPGYLSQIIWRIVPNDATRVGGVQSGELTAADTIPPVDVKSLQANSSLTVAAKPIPGVPYLLAINEQHAPWNNATARLALRDALNIPPILNALYFGVYQQAWSPLTPSTLDYDTAVQDSWHYDPATANQLLDSLGYKRSGPAGYRMFNGQPLTLTYLAEPNSDENRLDVAQLMAGQLNQVGIKVNVVEVPSIGSLIADVQKGSYDIAGVDDTEADPSVLTDFFDSADQPTPSVFGINWSHLASKSVDNWLEQGSSQTGAARASAYDSVQSYTVSQAVAIPVYVPVFIYAYSGTLHGVTFDTSTEYPALYGAWLS